MVQGRVFLFQLLASLFLFTSCNEYQKALKNEDTKVKYELAEKYYNEGDYKRAVRLYEQIVPSFIGKPQGERVIYFYADSYYKLKDYYLSGYQFERFSSAYPKSDKAEEAAFYGAKSYYYLSPKYSIDQTDTNKAIGKLQDYINSYPNSERISEANEMVQELRAKLEKKAFETAKQYNTIRDYYASIRSFELFLLDYPGSVYREDAMYHKFIASYNLAINSIYSKQEERLNDAKAAYNTLKKYYPATKYTEEAEKMLATIEQQLKRFSK
ncbi:outer membrane protein assembly factor BamD [Leptobacterium sp. I13]|uniref:outer membrane protein assembly factor BamD n=1 Tax=Leptobacterium meishanense TaxID=3128904 RepID=UPI0030EC32E3